MSNVYKYDDIINQLNKGKIERISFHIDGYAHYNECKIFQVYEPMHCLQIDLTKDKFESIRFYEMKENFKLFYLGRKGKYTLKQIWDKVIITEIVYNN